MIKALFRKQMLEVFAWVYKDKKSGKIRTAKGIAAYALLNLMLFGFLGVVFGFVADGLCEPLLQAGLGWLYWCLMALIAIFLGVFGSVFNTYSSLYQAKDNDLLLSMPVPVSYILLTRLSGVYAMGLMYEMIVMIPTMIIWLITAPLTFFGVVNVLLIPLVLSMLVLVFSAVLGWVIAVFMTKVKHKNIITVVLSLAFVGAYYYLYGRAYSMFQTFLLNAEQVGQDLQVVLYPLYHMGLAAEGNMLSMLIFLAVIFLLVAVVGFVLSKNFLKLATVNRGAGKAVYKEQTVKAGSVKAALLRKELKRFTGSANYMLNCGMGTILMPVSAVLLLWKAEMFCPLFTMLPADGISLLTIGAVCLLVSMNVMSAPSVSLEGNNLWIVQSLPVSGRQVLEAKLKLHLYLTLIPALVLVIAVEWLIRPELFYAVALPVITVLFVLLIAAIGLSSNLKMPNLYWSNEVIPIKQSMPTMIALFGGWFIVTLMAGIYYLLHSYVSVMTFVVGAAIVLAVADYILLRWIMCKGARIFEQLQ